METEHQEETGFSIEARLRALEKAVAELTAALAPDLLVSRIALPVATSILKGAAQHKPAAQFFTMLDTGETLIKYSAALAFALVSQRGGDERQAVFDMFSVSPSLGTIASGLRKSISGPGSNEWPLSVMRDVFQRANGKPTATARYLLDEFIALRNSDRGHGVYLADGYYEDLFLRNSTQVQDCVGASAHILLTLVRVEDMKGAGAKYAYNATKLMGSTPTLFQQPLISSSTLTVGGTYLWHQPEHFLSVEPFVTYRYCTVCRQEHIFFAERITANTISYHSPVSNHRIDVARVPP